MMKKPAVAKTKVGKEVPTSGSLGFSAKIIGVGVGEEPWGGVGVLEGPGVGTLQLSC